MGNDWLIGCVTLVVALGLIFGVSSSCLNRLQASETEQVKACVAAGGSWVLAENRLSVMECVQK